MSPFSEYPEDLAYIKSEPVKEAFRYMISAAKDLDDYTATAYHHGSKRAVNYYFKDRRKDRRIPFAFIINRESLLFYLRHPRRTHPTLTTAQLGKIFHEVKRLKNKEGEITFRILDVDDARRAMQLVFGVDPPALPPTGAKAKPQKVPADSKGGTLGLVPRNEIANRDIRHLTPFAIKVLGILANATRPVTRDYLKRITRVQKGWSKLFGAVTHGFALRPGLIGLRLVDYSREGREFSYVITTKGRKVLAAASKTAKPTTAKKASELAANSPDDLQRDVAEESSQSQRGAGFGNAVENKIVEDAAIRAVTKSYETNRWDVHSVERDKCGFDLDCRKGQAIEKVEVKGVRGTEQCFVITAGEVKLAQTNRNFVLVVVTSALSASPVLTPYTGSEFCRMFELSPVQFRAIFRKPMSGNP